MRYLAILLCIFLCAGCQPPNSHRETQCTIVFTTAKKYQDENGTIIVEREDPDSLTCTEVWKPNED